MFLLIYRHILLVMDKKVIIGIIDSCYSPTIYPWRIISYTAAINSHEREYFLVIK